MNNLKPIKTPVGYVSGRDGFYLDALSECKESNQLIFTGEINTDLASDYSGSSVWVKYKLVFNQVDSFSYEDVDVSNFQEEASFVKSEYGKFIFATYDNIYTVYAKSFTFELGDERS